MTWYGMILLHRWYSRHQALLRYEGAGCTLRDVLIDCNERKGSINMSKNHDLMLCLVKNAPRAHQGAPVLICPVQSPTAKSAIYVSSVSPLR